MWTRRRFNNIHISYHKGWPKEEVAKTEEELASAQEEILNLTIDIIDVKGKLKREEDNNTLGVSYIPEDQCNDYYRNLPNRQPPAWAPSSPASPDHPRYV